MRITQLSPRVRQLNWLGVFNCYLVEDEAGDLTLVDTGAFARCGETIRATAGERLRRVVLTHAHADHVGGLESLIGTGEQADNPSGEPPAAGLEFALSSREARILGGDHQLDPGEPPARLRGLLPAMAVRPTQLLHDGQTIGSMRVITSPGHTPGHIALLNDDGVLLAGDAFVGIFGLRVCSEDNPGFPFTQAATWHAPTAITSARHLANLHPAVLAMGHGSALFNPADAMTWAVDRAEEAHRRK